MTARHQPGPGVTAPFLISWQTIQHAGTGVVRTEQAALQVGGWLLALLAVAGLAVLAGRRMIEQTRRVGLLKASQPDSAPAAEWPPS